MSSRIICALISATCLLFNLGIEASKKLQKTYFTINDLLITDQELYLYNARLGYLEVNDVYSNDEGLYFLEAARPEEASDTCFNGHKIWCWRCLGCASPWCKGRCKCVEWPFGAQ